MVQRGSCRSFENNRSEIMTFNQFKREFKNHFKFSNYFNRVFTYNSALVLGFIFYRLKFSPNLITIFSLAFGLLGCYSILEGYYEVSAILLFISVVIDYCDGAISRITNKQTRVGEILDILVDRAVDTLFWMIIYSLYKNQGIYFLILIFIIILSHNFINIVSAIESKNKSKSITSKKSKWLRDIIYTPIEVDFLMLVVPLTLRSSNFIFFISFISGLSFIRILYILKKHL
jgi:phosphatidylglycerophosphate synthase